MPPAVSYQDTVEANVNNVSDDDEPDVDVPTPTPDLDPDTDKPAVIDEENTSINLAVPFQPQAPYADWSLPYKEACEEASVTMVAYYYGGQKLDQATMKQKID